MDDFNKAMTEFIERLQRDHAREKLAINLGYLLLDFIERLADYLKEGGWG